jgi:hypothetical protein
MVDVDHLVPPLVHELGRKNPHVPRQHNQFDSCAAKQLPNGSLLSFGVRVIDRQVVVRHPEALCDGPMLRVVAHDHG